MNRTMKWILFFFLACGVFSSVSQAIEKRYVKNLVGRSTGILPWDVREISGLAHCQTTPDRLWAINDRGAKPRFYALSLKAELLESHLLDQDKNKDWEDLACGRCAGSEGECLYIGDIGSNKSSRKKVRLYMIPLPIQYIETDGRKSIVREVINLRYPSGEYNAEALMVHPTEAIAVLITKEKRSQATLANPQIFSIDLEKALGEGKHVPMHSEGELPLTRYLNAQDAPGTGWITSGDFFPSGKWLAVMSYTHIFRVPWPLPKKSSKRIMLPIWSNVNRSQLESFSFHINQNNFWMGAEVNRSREPLFLMDLPLHR